MAPLPTLSEKAAPAVTANLRAAVDLLARRARDLREGLAVLSQPATSVKSGKDADGAQHPAGPIVELAQRVEEASALKGLSLSARSRLTLVGCTRLVHVALLTDEDVLDLALDPEAEALVRIAARQVVKVLRVAIETNGVTILDNLPIMGLVRSALRRLASLSGTDLPMDEVTQPSLSPNSAAGVAIGPCYAEMLRMACFAGEAVRPRPSPSPKVAADISVGPCYAEMLRLAEQAGSDAAQSESEVSPCRAFHRQPQELVPWTVTLESCLSELGGADHNAAWATSASLAPSESAPSQCTQGTGREPLEHLPCLAPAEAGFLHHRSAHGSPSRAPSESVASSSSRATCRELLEPDPLMAPPEADFRGADRHFALAHDESGSPNQSVASLPSRLVMEDFEVLGLLGAGSFGVVTLELHRPSGSVCALKRVSKGLIVKMGMQEKLQNERDVLRAATGSKFISRLYGTINCCAHVVFVLEACLGGDLYQVYAQNGFTGSSQHTRFYTACVASALDFLHRQHVAYRDLKPENVLVASSGYAKLTDMGIAKRLAGPTFTTCGSVAYFAPEVIAQQGYGDAVDWWALGVFTYELLTGCTPFESDNAVQTYRRIIKGIAEADFTSAAFSFENSDFIRRLCARDPRGRLASGATGFVELMEHMWYRGLDWSALGQQLLPPPFMPSVRSDQDLSNFLPVDENEFPPEEVYADPGTGWDADF